MGSPDVIVVGAGPAGLATAIALRLGGRDVRVLEKRKPPLDKACGEGIMPLGVARLKSLGVMPEESFSLEGIRYVTALGERVTARFPSGHLGLGVRRLALHAALAARAIEIGVEIQWGTEVKGFTGGALATSAGQQRAAWYVGADGLHSTLKDYVVGGAEVSGSDRKGRAQEGGSRQTFPLQTLPPKETARRRIADSLRQTAAQGLTACVRLTNAKPRPERYGLRQHFLTAPWSPYIEVYWHESCEAYVTPVSPGCIGVALLFSERPASFAGLLSHFPELERRLRGLAPASEVRGSGPLWQPRTRRVRHNVALVGDAAGYLDAITGEGLSLAFEEAHLLAEALQQDAWSGYALASQRLRRQPEAIIRALLVLQARPRLTARLLESLCASPSLFTHLVEMNCGLAEPWCVPLRGLLQAGVHLVRSASPPRGVAAPDGACSKGDSASSVPRERASGADAFEP